jgi:glutamine synthetase
MLVMQNTARRYGLVCLLHEKPFAGVNGSGKHNNWSMGTDTGQNLLDPGDTPHENMEFLFFCAAVIKAVNRHQGLLRASIASPGQDHRLGANEAPPAIISIFLGAELEKVFGAIERGEAGESTPESFLGLGTPVLPPLPMHGGDRNRTSPFAFTGNKFEFRALGSSMSLSFPNTVLNTIVAQAIDELAGELEKALADGRSLEAALPPILQRVYADNKQIVFGGDNYSPEWHEEAEQRGLLNLRATPDALPYLINDETTELFSAYSVLSKRELESRYEVFLEQYNTKINIEAETAASIARTMVLPAAARHVALLKGADMNIPGLNQEAESLTSSLVASIRELEEVNRAENHPEEDPLEHARYTHDRLVPAMESVREAADALERVVADDLWPLPKYSEILFIK